jgi:hypothetical protein
MQYAELPADGMSAARCPRDFGTSRSQLLEYYTTIPRIRKGGEDSSWPILLQKSKVAGPRIFRENSERKAITDSYDLNRIAEVACEFDVRR